MADRRVSQPGLVARTAACILARIFSYCLLRFLISWLRPQDICLSRAVTCTQCSLRYFRKYIMKTTFIVKAWPGTSTCRPVWAGNCPTPRWWRGTRPAAPSRHWPWRRGRTRPRPPPARPAAWGRTGKAVNLPLPSKAQLKVFSHATSNVSLIQPEPCRYTAPACRVCSW